MKFNFRKLWIPWLFLISFFVPSHSKAAAKKDISARVNKVRKELQQKTKNGESVEVTGSQFNNNTNPGDWVNWGNWGNWNNWRNWNNWNNWGNWGNWRNY